LNFSLMATYGGELSLERFLALQARAVPFDAAHAVGNAALALVAGPAMIRMLVRFRQRFEWRVPAVASLLLVALLAVATLPDRAEAAETGKTVAWLSKVQNADGGWGPSTDRDSSPETTAWVMLGLEAAGVNPLDVAQGGRTPVEFLRANVEELSSAGDFARTILALQGAGLDPRSFAGQDMVEALLNRRAVNGSYHGWPGSTAFAVIALRAAGATGSIDHSAAWLARVQNGDGGWGDVPGSVSTADGTAAVMQAMPHTKPAVDALDYLRRHQRSNGGFVTGGSGPVNAQSTAWAVQGMLAVGADPATIREGGDSALDYLAARRGEDGHYDYSAGSDQTPIWVTGQVLTAVAGEAFPVPAPPRKPKPEQEPEAGIGAGSLAAPETGGAESLPLPESSESGSSAPGEVPPAAGVPPSGGAPLPGVPGATGPGLEGAAPETGAATSLPPFEASENAGPKPWAPVGIGLGTGGLALGGVLFLGRRFGW
ncbi:MAG TPA: prenyltransferase/squalene oxidase repeat-containing protein, partial [Actinomycetota bacterium]